MTADVIPGPPCDICGEEFAAMSLLSYGDYSQVKTGVNCAPDFLRSIADSIDGKSTAEPPPSEPTDTPGNAADAGPAESPGTDGGQGADADPFERSAGSEPNTEPSPPDDDDEPGSARDHWASTTHVRRSTHGHRRTSSATGEPRSEPAE